MKKLSKKEINELLNGAEQAVKTDASLTAVFEKFAAEHNRAKGGVRNLYYKLLKEYRENEKLAKDHPSLRNLRAERSRAFGTDEQEEMFEKIRRGVSDGKSARKVIGELAGGDQKLALRFQNKYRNMLRQRGLTKPRVSRGDSNFDSVKRAIDELFEKIVQKRSQREEQLYLENESLKKRLTMAEEFISQNRIGNYFAVKDESAELEKK